MNQFGTRTEPFSGPTSSPTIAWDLGLPSSPIRFHTLPDPCLPLLRFVAVRAKAVSEGSALSLTPFCNPSVVGCSFCAFPHQAYNSGKAKAVVEKS